MEIYLTYALKVILCSGITYVFYKFFIEGKTGYAFCRAYLISALIVSAVIPALTIPVFAGEVIEIPVAPITYDYEIMAQQIIEPIPTAAEISPWFFFGYAYLLIALFFIVRIVIELINIGKYTSHGVKSMWGDIKVYEGPDIKTPFTFFKRVFIPAGLPSHEKEQILTHEASHARHNHGAELLSMEFIKAWQWFNPFAWLSRRSLEEVHEYQADNDVIKKGYDLENYKNLLFRQLVGYSPDISSGLACSKTKKRFIMMGKTKTAPRNLLRGLTAIPLLGAMLLLFSFTTKDPVYKFNEQPEQPDNIYLIDESGNLGYVLPTDPDIAGKMYYFLDGKEVTLEEIKALNAESIESMSMIGDAEVLKEYGKDPASAGIVLVTLKGSKSQPSGTQNLSLSAAKNMLDATYYLDGKEVPADILNRLSEESIELITVLSRDNSELLLNKPGGVILITSKKEDKEKHPGKMAQFHGGDMSNFTAWVHQHIALDPRSNGLEGKVSVGFCVDESGKLTDIIVRESPSELMSTIVTDILERSPAWTPARKANSEATLSAIGLSFTFGQEKPFTAVEKMPTYKELGINAFQAWATQKVVNDPESKGETGRVEVSFVVDKQGRVSDVSIINSPSLKMGGIVKRILESSDPWTPGTQNGTTVPVQFRINIDLPKIETVEITRYAASTGEDEPFIQVEDMPVFQGGSLSDFREWAAGKLASDPRAKGKNGKVVVSFIIEKDGQISNVERLSSPSTEIFEIVKEVLESSPKWIPGMQRGKAVRVRFNLPVDFKSDTAPYNGEPFVNVENMPQFQGGDLKDFSNWVQQNVVADPRAKGMIGKVVVTFVINNTGRLIDVQRLMSPSDEMFELVKDILESSPEWTPGTQKGTPVPVRFNLPINFASKAE